MMSKKQFLENFLNIADSRIAFDLLDKSHLEGYILEIKENSFLFSDPNPINYPYEKDEREINIEDIDVSSFYYYKKEWINFKPIN